MATLRMDPDNRLAKNLRGRVKALELIKKEGNTLYVASHWEEAITKYNECLEVCTVPLALSTDNHFS